MHKLIFSEFVWSVNQSWAEETLAFEQTLTNQKKKEFYDKLLELKQKLRGGHLWNPVP